MDKYSVKLLSSAVIDLNAIFKYIAIDKSSLENAKAQVSRIRNSILNLSIFQNSHQDRLIGRFAGNGYKQLIVDNYIVIYRINEKEKVVYVVTIQYQGRNI